MGRAVLACPRIRSMADPKTELRILPMPDTEPPTPWERIAAALERIANRLDHDAETFDEMVAKGKNLST